MTAQLFDTGPVPEPAPTGAGVDARRTARRNGELAAGRHPRTKLPLRLPPRSPETCGSCRWQVDHALSRTYHKCNVGGTATGGPATDVRLGWPACMAWERRPDAGDGR